MRIPIARDHQPQKRGERKIDIIAGLMLGGCFLMSTIIWGLAMAKVIDLFG